MNFLSTKYTIVTFIVLLLISTSLTLFLLKSRQEQRSHAEKSSTLSFLPDSSTTPIQKNPDEPVDLNLKINPGNNLVTSLKFQISYDPTKLQLSTAEPFTINATAFPVKVEGPLVTGNSLVGTFSIGSDSTKVIKSTTNVGTVHFKAIGGTGGTPTLVTFSSGTLVLSSAATDQSSENVLSSTTPAKILISGNASSSASPGSTDTPGTTTLSFELLLHGIGNAGDNPNPAGNDLSNKDPLHPQRNLEVHVYNNSNDIVSTKSGALVYDHDSGSFKGKLDIGPTVITGNYIIKIRTDGYLRKLIPGVQKITKLQDNPIPPTALIAGDTNDDNNLNILDYNALLDCGYGSLNSLPMEDPQSVFQNAACQVHTPAEHVDLDDNGIINGSEYNLFLRELSVQSGD